MLLGNSQEGLQRCLTAYKKCGVSEDTEPSAVPAPET